MVIYVHCNMCFSFLYLLFDFAVFSWPWSNWNINSMLPDQALQVHCCRSHCMVKVRSVLIAPLKELRHNILSSV